jgi:hypothetical protein
MKNGHGSEKNRKVKIERVQLGREGKARAVGAIFTVVIARSILGTDPRMNRRARKTRMREKSRNIYFLQQESQGVQSNDPKALRRSRKIAFQSHYNLELRFMFGYPFHALSDPL